MPLLAVISDVHYELDHLHRCLARAAARKVDGLLLVGDLGWHGLGRGRTSDPAVWGRYLRSVAEVLAAARSVGPIAWVPGNHDPHDLAARLGPIDGEGVCDGAVRTLAGLRIYGIGGAGPARFGFPYEWSEAEIFARPSPDCDIILSHTPPAGTPLDLVARGEDLHVGSEAIRARALAHRGALVCGHIHESPAATWLNECLCFNPGGLGAPYGAAQMGFLDGTDAVEWEQLDLGVGWRRGRESRQS